MKALVLVVLVAACACASTQQQSTPQRRTLGITTCNGEPEAWVSLTALADTMIAPGVIAHEQDHKRFMQSFPSCDAYTDWRNSEPLMRLLLEARAFCAHAIADVNSGRSPTFEHAVKTHSVHLARNYGSNIAPDRAERFIRAFCGGAK